MANLSGARVTAVDQPPAQPTGTFRRIMENAAWLLAGKGCGAVLSLIYLAIATRSLGPADFGQFALILSAAQGLGALVAFQTWQIVVRFGMEHLQGGRLKELRGLLTATLWLDVGGAIAGCLIAYFGVGAMGLFFGWDEAVQLQALLFTFVMLLSVRSTAVGILRLHDRFKAGAAADAATPIVRMIGAVLVLLTGPSVAGFLLAWAAAEVATAATCWILALRTADGVMTVRAWPRFKSILRAHPGLAGFAASTNVSYTLEGVAKQFSTVIVGLFVGPAAAGHYRLAFQLGQGFAKLSDLLSRSVYSELTRVRFGEGAENLVKLFRTSLRFSVLGAAVIVLLLLLLAKPALLLLAGPEFAPAYPLLLLLGTAAALDFAGVNFEPALLAAGRAGTLLTIRIVVTCLLVALLLILLPLLGAAGSAIATLSASAAGLALFGLAAWRAVHRPA